MFAKRNPTQMESESKRRKGNDGGVIDVDAEEEVVEEMDTSEDLPTIDIPESSVTLRSVQKLRNAVVTNADAGKSSSGLVILETDLKHL